MIDPKLLRTDPDAVARNLARRGYQLDVAALQALEERAQALAGGTGPLARRAQCQRQGRRHRQGARRGHRCPARGRRGTERGAGAYGSAIGRRAGGSRAVATRTAESSARVGSGRTRRERQSRGAPRRGSRARSVSSRAITWRSASGSWGLDFEAATRISGSRFVVMRAGVARLHRALAQFMLDLHSRETRLHRGVRAVPGAACGAHRHRAAAEVRAGSVRGARASRASTSSRPPRCR